MDAIKLATLLILLPSTSGILVRLVGGSSRLEGRIEIYYSRWGTVCDDSFDNNDAKVICHMLGFSREGATAYGSATLGGAGSGQIWLDELACTGTESSVSSCAKNSWGSHDCGHNEDAGVRCQPKTPGFRLIGGSNDYEGRIEVYVLGSWGTVCDDSFGNSDAQVFCYMLGYNRYGAVAKSSAYFGAGSGSIWLDDLGCSGSETSINACSKNSGGWGAHNCGHSEDAGVVCRPKSCSALPSVTNGRYSSSSCTRSSVTAGQECRLICNTGYQHSFSYSYTRCSGTGSWSVSSSLLSCSDKNECSAGTSGCSHQCANTVGSFTCSCYSGYLLSSDRRTCMDKNECSLGTSGCTQQCKNTAGSFTCSCNSGFLLSSNGKTCTDIDECTTTATGCSQICLNTDGSYECSCNEGYTLASDNITCIDIDECTAGMSNCTQICVNTDGSYGCSCNEGYTLASDNKTCSDIDECAEGISGCSQICSNTDGSYYCSCNTGYILVSDNKTCNDIDECTLGTSGCAQTCSSTAGSSECSCIEGFALAPDSRPCNGL